ncbi:hypothetical protein Tco_0703502 [Tanacetum coccineum]|uniref:Uncharacterized protein n=1 Tax=Tanacetum coccineum TaxID=301880 RepID=A0ABQ4XZG7_9ASTR
MKLLHPLRHLVDDDLDEEEAIKVTEKKNLENDIGDETLEIDEIVNIKESKNHPLENVIMPRKTSEDDQNTRDYIPIISHEYTSPLKEMLRNLESHFIHEGQFVMGESSKLFNESYVLYDRVMYPLTAQQERKTQKDYGMKRGRHSTSSSSAFGQPSSSHLNDDDDDGNDKVTLRVSTPSPTHFVNSLTNEVP